MAGKSERIAGALQENVLALLCTSDDHCQTVRQGIDLRLYSNEIFRNIARKAYDFIDAHGVAPKEHLPDLLEEYTEGKEGRLYSELMHGIRLLGENLNIKYVVGQLGVFVQEHALRLGITEAAEALQNDDLDGARSVIEAALRRTAPVFERGTQLLDTIASMMRGEAVRDIFPCGVRELDREYLGPARGEMWMMVGAPKRGKTWGLINTARAALLYRKKVLYVTLEVSERIIAQRIIQSLTGYRSRKRETDTSIPRVVMKETGVGSAISHITHKVISDREYLQEPEGSGRIAEGLRKAQDRITQLRINDRLRIKAFPTGSLAPRELVTYLDQLERIDKFVPDEIIVDYADLCAIDKSNYRLSLGGLLKDLRGMAVTRNHALVTASQLNRPGAGMGYATETNIAEDFSKVAIADVVIIFNQLVEEKRQGVGRLYVANSRNEMDKFSVLVTQNYEIGQFVLASCPEPSNYRDYLRSLRHDDRGADEPDAEHVGRERMNGSAGLLRERM